MAGATGAAFLGATLDTTFAAGLAAGAALPAGLGMETPPFLAAGAALGAAAGAALVGAFLPPKLRNMVVVVVEALVVGAAKFLPMNPPMKAEAGTAAKARVTREVFILGGVDWKGLKTVVVCCVGRVGGRELRTMPASMRMRTRPAGKKTMPTTRVAGRGCIAWCRGSFLCCVGLKRRGWVGVS